MSNYKIPWESIKNTSQADIGALSFIIDKFNDDKYVLRVIFRGGVDYKKFKSIGAAKKGADKIIKKRIKNIKDELKEYKRLKIEKDE